MRDLTAEIEKAVPFTITFSKEFIIGYAINKRGYDFDWEYEAGENTMEVYKGDECIGVILTDFPLAFILEKVYDEFLDNELKEHYHIVKTDDFGKEEWCLNVKRMKEVAPFLQWIYSADSVPIDVTKFCIADFEFCVQ